MENILLNMKSQYEGNVMSVSDFDMKKTVVIVIDMVKGFVNEGLLASPRVEKMSYKLVETLKGFKTARKVFFRDCHYKDSKEILVRGEHCMYGTSESCLIDSVAAEVDNFKDVVIYKNSTNGFLTEDFQRWLSKNNDIENFVIVGCVTDICVSDFAKTLLCYIHENNLDKEVIVPIDCVETYDYGAHNAELMNVVSLYNMKTAGIKVVDSIKQ